MNRKVWVLGITAIVGTSLVLSTLNASACDESKKTASAASASSCCAKDGAKTASVDGKKVHNSMVKSAVVAPGAAPILNVAAFGAMMAGGNHVGDCEWCPGMSMASTECATKMSASECASKMRAKQASVVTADTTGQATGATVASNQHAGCGSATMAMAGGEGCGAKATNAS